MLCHLGLDQLILICFDLAFPARKKIHFTFLVIKCDTLEEFEECSSKIGILRINFFQPKSADSYSKEK